ncbi:ankyrin repeat domain-containing protein [Frigoriflavimonas asaccharolytica]|uniref:Ankyrin repeat protein n=1 Tax=Frigoriflavimonas asaccharolytica TaxID=2735899 RepID=A0A8J8G792_9FLAO|nr:ankyrin repeat domain-containing protein [Frigoriflavimonas asaccharolytica]NRS92606.1 hypothetical protein [Frigoriflavimonas asaccharolytica]
MKIFLILLFFPLIFFSQNKDVFDVARNGTVAEMQALMDINNDTINTKNNNGFSPLLLACYRGNTDVAEFLIDHVKNIDEMSPEGTALVASIFKGDQKLSELLLKKGANPDVQNGEGITALMYAVQNQNEDLVKLLLRYKTNIKLKDKQDKTAFEYAVFSKNKNITNLLKN